MSKTISTLLFCFTALLFVAQTKVNYSVYYSPNLEKDGLKVTLDYTSKVAKDSFYFHFSNHVWGQDDLFHCLQINESENPGLKYRFVPDSNRIVVYVAKTKKIQLTYHIRQDFVGDSLHLTNRPRMNNHYFHVLGEELFTVPEAVFETKDRLISAEINWINFPDDYVIHNTFATKQKKQIVEGNLFNTLYRSLFVGGDYRTYSFDFKGKPVVFAIRGKWYGDYQDDKPLFEALKRTIETQRTFWNDYNQAYYTVIMTPTVSQNDSLYEGQSTVGSAVKNGFMIQSSNNPFNNMEVINYIFNHEMMHDWIGLKIMNAHEELNYWFSEGFTDYYTYKNRLKSGDITKEVWQNSFNEEVILAHYKNPEKNCPNYRIKDDFWKSRNIEKVPYRRGAIFAFWLDNKIMKLSNNQQSLDDLMRQLLSKCTSENVRLTDELFLTEASKFLKGQDISYEFQKYVLIGEDLPLGKAELLDCFEIKIVDQVPQIHWKIGEQEYVR